jgi:hypothetical protein
MHSMKKRLRPKMPTNQPLTGKMIALETKYEVRTQVLSSVLAPRSPAMCGSATLAMLVSSTSMKAASETTTAMSHGLTSALAAGTNSLAAPSVVMDGKDSLELSCGGGRV